MASSPKRKPSRGTRAASLANRARADKRLFLPMELAIADANVMRFRIAFNVAAAGRGGLPELRALSHAVMMAGLVADIEPGVMDDNDLRICERFFAERLLASSDDWALSGESQRAALVVLNEHDRQLRQCLFQTIIMATERFDRIAASASSADQIFALRRAQKAQQASAMSAALQAGACVAPPSANPTTDAQLTEQRRKRKP